MMLMKKEKQKTTNEKPGIFRLLYRKLSSANNKIKSTSNKERLDIMREILSNISPKKLHKILNVFIVLIFYLVVFLPVINSEGMKAQISQTTPIFQTTIHTLVPLILVVYTITNLLN